MTSGSRWGEDARAERWESEHHCAQAAQTGHCGRESAELPPNSRQLRRLDRAER